MSIIKKSFEGFTVYSDDERNSFIHVDINDSSKFCKKTFEYLMLCDIMGYSIDEDDWD